MASPDLAGFVKVGQDILTTTVNPKTKKILCQLGDVHRKTTDTDNAEMWSPSGWIARPPKPVEGKQAPQAATLQASDHDIVFATQDERGRDLAGELGFGEFMAYAAGADGKAQGRIIGKGDGSITVFTRKGNTKDGTGMMVQVDAKNGAIRLINDKGYGIIIDGDGVTITAKDAALTLTGSGNAKLIAKQKTQVDGAGVVIGSVAVPVVNSAITGPAGIIGKASLKVLIESFVVGVGLGSLLYHLLT